MIQRIGTIFPAPWNCQRTNPENKVLQANSLQYTKRTRIFNSVSKGGEFFSYLNFMPWGCVCNRNAKSIIPDLRKESQIYNALNT